MTETIFMILIGIIIILLFIIVFLVSNNKKKNIHIVKTNTPDELAQLMTQQDFPTEMIESMLDNDENFAATKTVRTVKYINGEKVSDETKTTNHNLPPLTVCPRCGEKLSGTSNDMCQNCNIKIITK